MQKDPSSSPSGTVSGTPCGLLRRLASISYDGLIVVAVWMLGTAVVVVVRGQAVGPESGVFQLFLWLLAWPYFAVCWIHGGQTLGMRAWKIHLEPARGRLRWSGTLVRYATAWISALVLGAGFLWSPGRSA